MQIKGNAVLIDGEPVGKIERCRIAPGWMISLHGDAVVRDNPDGTRSTFDTPEEAAAYAAANPRMFKTAARKLPDLDIFNVWGFWVMPTGVVVQTKWHEDDAAAEFGERTLEGGNAVGVAMAAG